MNKADVWCSKGHSTHSQLSQHVATRQTSCFPSPVPSTPGPPLNHNTYHQDFHLDQLQLSQICFGFQCRENSRARGAIWYVWATTILSTICRKMEIISAWTPPSKKPVLQTMHLLEICQDKYYIILAIKSSPERFEFLGEIPSKF